MSSVIFAPCLEWIKFPRHLFDFKTAVTDRDDEALNDVVEELFERPPKTVGCIIWVFAPSGSQIHASPSMSIRYRICKHAAAGARRSLTMAGIVGLDRPHVCARIRSRRDLLG